MLTVATAEATRKQTAISDDAWSNEVAVSTAKHFEHCIDGVIANGKVPEHVILDGKGYFVSYVARDFARDEVTVRLTVRVPHQQPDNGPGSGWNYGPLYAAVRSAQASIEGTYSNDWKITTSLDTANPWHACFVTFNLRGTRPAESNG